MVNLAALLAMSGSYGFEVKAQLQTTVLLVYILKWLKFEALWFSILAT